MHRIKIPTLYCIVSDAQPKQWRRWLREECEIRGKFRSAIWYGVVNCNYIVVGGYVWEFFGYHGGVAFRKLKEMGVKKWLAERLAGVRKLNAELKELLGGKGEETSQRSSPRRTNASAHPRRGRRAQSAPRN